MFRKFTLITLYSVISIIASASELDSLMIAYTKAKNDSLKARTCLQIGDHYEDIDIDKAIHWGKQAVVYARNTGNQKFIIKAINYAASYYFKKADYHKQIGEYLKAYQLAEKNKFFEMQGGIASNIGSTYERIGDTIQSLKWLEKAVDLKKEYSTPDKLALSIGNLGSYYFDIGEYEKAVSLFNEALVIQLKYNNLESTANLLGNLGDCYLLMENYIQAEKHYMEQKRILEQIGDPFRVASWMLNVSWLKQEQGQSLQGLHYADSALQIAREHSYEGLEHNAMLIIADINMSMGNKDLAYEQLKEAYSLWQELNNKEANENLNELRTKYETERVENENLLLKKDSEIDAALISEQKTIIFASAGGLIALIVLVYFLFKWNKDKRKKNALLSEQKKLVEEKNREVLDSINYAQRIQAAILPAKERIRAAFPQSFVFYRPKDVVAGDFYWLESKGDLTLFAVADCTGHGVPGAMVSVFCNNGLNRSVREKNLTIPGKVLDQTREIVLEEFDKSGQEVNDGMDIALCSLKGNTLQYAGAHNPIWIIRKGGLIEYRANKQPIGKYENPEPYTTHVVSMEPGDMLYLFTDGIVDQFGGEEGKKLKSVNFKRFLISIAELSISEQESALAYFFDDWKGKNEQIDDVCVMGIRF